MRLIVALAVVPFLHAQSLREQNIARGEANLQKDPERISERGMLLRVYSGVPGEVMDERSRLAMRRHILWLIEHHPEAPDLGTYLGMIESSGPNADPEGRAQAERLWREQAAKPGASGSVLANAAWFFKLSDRDYARSLVNRAPEDPAAARMRGILDVLDWAGAIAMERMDSIARIDAARAKPAAIKEIDSSENAALLGGAGEFLIHQGPAIRSVVDMAEAADIAERWLTKAHQLDPANKGWAASLAEVYQRQAMATADPRWKAQLLLKSLDLSNNVQRPRFLVALAEAEFQAGDDKSAERDANALLELKDPAAIFNGHTILGRIAADRGDLEAAKKHLLDSARMEGSPVLASFGPKMTLAQDLLDRGERDVVVEFLELCRAFWKYDRGFIDHFQPIIKNGGKPDLLAFYNPNRGQPPPKLPAPEVIAGAQPKWKRVAGAESYVVEWDFQQNGKWLSESEGTVRVVPTRDTFADLDHAPPLRWRVFAVSVSGPGEVSAWTLLK